MRLRTHDSPPQPKLTTVRRHAIAAALAILLGGIGTASALGLEDKMNDDEIYLKRRIAGIGEAVMRSYQADSAGYTALGEIQRELIRRKIDRCATSPEEKKAFQEAYDKAFAEGQQQKSVPPPQLSFDNRVTIMKSVMEGVPKLIAMAERPVSDVDCAEIAATGFRTAVTYVLTNPETRKSEYCTVHASIALTLEERRDLEQCIHACERYGFIGSKAPAPAGPDDDVLKRTPIPKACLP
jgi:hypothetical protein